VTEAHPLGELLIRAAAGAPPAADGGWHREIPWHNSVFGIVTFTGHAVLVVPDDVDDAKLAALEPDGFGGAADPRLVASLAGESGWIDSLDVLLAAPGSVEPARALTRRMDLADRPRARRAASLRTAVEVYGAADHDDAVFTIGRGIGGLPELSFEISPEVRGSGLGRRLITDARSLVKPDETLLVSVAPGNVASLRATLAAGFRPIAGVQLFRPGSPDG
jgi:GNAT superfamily N-acetyltransferase